MNVTTFDNRAVAALLHNFADHLVCWKVTRVIGSMIYIEMGRRWSSRLKTRNEEINIGSLSLSLEADSWVMQLRDQPVADAASLSDNEMASILAVLVGRKLQSVKFSRQHRTCRIVFSDRLLITLHAGPDDDDLCVLHLPDGTIIGCDAINGFQSDGSKSEAKVAAYALDKVV